MLSRISYKFLLFFIIPFIVKAVIHDIEIEERNIDCAYKVHKNGSVKKEYKKIVFDRFIESNLIDSSSIWEEFDNKTTTWVSFKEELNNGDRNRKKGIAAEVATIRFFGILGYKILEDHYQTRKTALLNPASNNEMQHGEPIRSDVTCTTKFGSDNGIDGLFIHLSEKIDKHSHIVINEAKFRDKESLYASDFGTIKNDLIRQSHSLWNKEKFSNISCFNGAKFDDEIVIRTATFLDKDGNLRLYEIKDKEGSNQDAIGVVYASKASKQFSIADAYSTFISNVKFALHFAEYNGYTW